MYMNLKSTTAVRKVVTLSERVHAQICPGPISSSPRASLVIKTTEAKPFRARLEPTLRTARTLAESPDYAPDWRSVLVEQYIHEINSQPEWQTDQAKQLKEIFEREPDQTVRGALQFHLGELPDSQKGPLEWALRCLRVTEIEMAIKAMILANVPIQYIAKEMGTDPSNIKTFELLCFDVRPYLQNRPWLRSVCFGRKGHRWLQVAFDRGWAGVKEVILQRPQEGERDLDLTTSVLLGRTQAWILENEASNTPPTEKELAMLVAIAPCLRKFPGLPDDAEQELPKGATQSSCADDPAARNRDLSELKDFAELPDNLDGCSLHELAEELRQDIARERSNG